MGEVFANQSLIHDESFLGVCDQSVKDFYLLWRSKISDGRLPSRKDFDPADMVRFLPRITMVNANPDLKKLNYRLVGTAEVEIRGKDPTGQLVMDNFLANYWGDVVRNYRHVIEEKGLVYDYSDMPTSYGGMIADETILLPLSDDGEVVNIVILYSVQFKKKYEKASQ